MINRLLLLTLCVTLTSLNKKKNHAFDERISMVNESVWDIKALYISEVEKNTWNENLLTNDVLSAGGGATIIKAPCGTYDLKVIDTDNHVCTIKNVNICGNDKKTVTITDQSIGSCLNN